tara:strand:+ start:483 stop:656 length:174 start_codon:yes stop_codon:yes gene_type:complete
MGSNNRDNGGFLARFLFVYPTYVEPNLFAGKVIESAHIEKYKSLITNLYNTKAITIK